MFNYQIIPTKEFSFQEFKIRGIVTEPEIVSSENCKKRKRGLNEPAAGSWLLPNRIRFHKEGGRVSQSWLKLTKVTIYHNITISIVLQAGFSEPPCQQLLHYVIARYMQVTLENWGEFAELQQSG